MTHGQTTFRAATPNGARVLLAAALSATLACGWALGQAPTAGTPEVAPYVLGLGDVIQVVVTGEPELSRTAPGLVIGPDGRIAYPPLGMIEATGKTCEQLAETIRAGLIRIDWLKDPQVTVGVAEYNAHKVNVIGAVKNPGSFPHRPGLRVRDAIALAGDVVVAALGGASTVRARIVHNDGTSSPVRLDHALEGYGEDGALELQPGDTLVVERQARISVLGYVRNPGYFEVSDSASLSEVLAMAGGVTPDGDLRQIVINRSFGLTEQVDLQGALTGGKQLDPAISAGDVIFVSRLRKEVSVLGYVGNPGQYAFNEGDRVSDLIAKAGGGEKRSSGGGTTRYSAGDLTKVTLTRSDGTVITLDVAAVLGGKQPSDATVDPLVQAGDTIFIPEERYEIVILGHVQNPGRYVLLPGDKVSDAIAMAGGPLRPTEIPARTTSADLAHTTLYRASGEKIALDLSALPSGSKEFDNPELLPGDTLVIPEASNRVSVAGYVRAPGYYEFRPGETVTAAIAMAGGVVPNVGSAAKVRVRHSGGAAEDVSIVDTDPALQPGDEIIVPFARNRVAVIGYVNAAGLYEWHEGDRVLDMIAQAGGAIPTSRTAKGGNMFHALVVRRVDGEEQYLDIDLSKYYDKKDPAVNILLQPDDVVYVPREDGVNYVNWLSNIREMLTIKNLIDIVF